MLASLDQRLVLRPLDQITAVFKVLPCAGAFMGKFVQVVEDSVIVDYDTDLAGRAFVVDGTVFLKVSC